MFRMEDTISFNQNNIPRDPDSIGSQIRCKCSYLHSPTFVVQIRLCACTLDKITLRTSGGQALLHHNFCSVSQFSFQSIVVAKMKLAKQNGTANGGLERSSHLHLYHSAYLCSTEENLIEVGQSCFAGIFKTVKPIEMRRKFVIQCIDKVLDLVEDDVTVTDRLVTGTDIFGDP